MAQMVFDYVPLDTVSPCNVILIFLTETLKLQIQMKPRKMTCSRTNKTERSGLF